MTPVVRAHVCTKLCARMRATLIISHISQHIRVLVACLHNACLPSACHEHFVGAFIDIPLLVCVRVAHAHALSRARTNAPTRTQCWKSVIHGEVEYSQLYGKRLRPMEEHVAANNHDIFLTCAPPDAEKASLVHAWLRRMG